MRPQVIFFLPLISHILFQVREMCYCFAGKVTELVGSPQLRKWAQMAATRKFKLKISYVCLLSRWGGGRHLKLKQESLI